MKNDSNILILGANGKLGQIITKALQKDKYNIIASDINFSDKFLTEMRSYNNVNLDISDVCSSNDVKRLYSESKISGVVNCTYPRGLNYGKELSKLTFEDFNESTSLALGSAFLIMQEALNYFKSNHQAISIINFSSIYGIVAPKFYIYEQTEMTMPVEYAAIKSSIIHLTKYFAKYANDEKFKINCISPGGVFDNQPEIFMKKYSQSTVGEGLLVGEDIIGPVKFLLSDWSKHITGQNIVIDDGFSL